MIASRLWHTVPAFRTKCIRPSTPIGLGISHEKNSSKIMHATALIGQQLKICPPLLCRFYSTSFIRNLFTKRDLSGQSKAIPSNRHRNRVAMDMRPVRSWFVPGKTEEKIDKALSTNPDVLFLDMEDSVEIDRKSSVRNIYKHYLRTRIDRLDTSLVFIRVNSLDTPNELREDLNSLISENVDGLILPKVMTSSDVHEYDKLVMDVLCKLNSPEKDIRYVPIIETMEGLANCDDIAKSSERISGLIAGTADFSADALCDENSGVMYELMHTVFLTARRNKIHPIAGAFTKIDDDIMFRNFCSQMKSLGFSGCTTLNPTQSKLATITFGVSEHEVDCAKRLLESRDDDKRGNNISTFVTSFNQSRQAVGPPHRALARSVIERYETQERMRIEQKFQSVQQARRQSNDDNDQIPMVLTSHKSVHNEVFVGEVKKSEGTVKYTEFLEGMWRASFDVKPDITDGASNIQFDVLMALVFGMPLSVFSENVCATLEFNNCVQIKPVDRGDILTLNVKILDAKNINSRKGNIFQGTVLNSEHFLVNQNEETVFSFEKTSLFDRVLHISNMSCNSVTSDKNDDESIFEKERLGISSKRFVHTSTTKPRNISPGCKLPRRPADSTKTAECIHDCSTQPGALIIHKDMKTFSLSEMSSLHRLCHVTTAYQYNTHSYRGHSDVTLAPPLIISSVLSNATRDIEGVVAQELVHCAFVNKLNPYDTVATLTYVINHGPIAKVDGLSQTTLCHLGIKNLDPFQLQEMKLPRKLFTSEFNLPEDLEELCYESCPALYKRIVCRARRNVVRPM